MSDALRKAIEDARLAVNRIAIKMPGCPDKGCHVCAANEELVRAGHTGVRTVARVALEEAAGIASGCPTASDRQSICRHCASAEQQILGLLPKEGA